MRSGRAVIKIFPGAHQALQRLVAGEYGGVRIAAASSPDTLRAVSIGRAAMALLEVVSGTTLEQAFASIGSGTISDPAEGDGHRLRGAATAAADAGASMLMLPLMLMLP